jgi:exonuclease III
MKIVTWNLERLKKNKNEIVLSKLTELDADILILTETDSQINLGEKYSSISTQNLFNGYDEIAYKNTENRATIWTKYKIVKQHKTYDKYTSVCAEIQTDFGLLNVYGTIIGVFGGKGERFQNDMKSQSLDFENISGNICLAGDFNIALEGFAYPSHKARNEINETFEKLNLKCLTSEIIDNVDHIAISKSYIENRKINIEIWNEDKVLSDHIGICITL